MSPTIFQISPKQIALTSFNASRLPICSIQPIDKAIIVFKLSAIDKLEANTFIEAWTRVLLTKGLY